MFKAKSHRELERAFGRSPTLRRKLEGTARDGATNARRLVPQLPGNRRIIITHGVRIGDNGAWESYVKATGSFWHLPEFGAWTWAQRPYLRPGVHQALAARRGRLKET